ncbi:PREDICTED: uncharacterized protein C9orf50 homolog [Hipposideros armiger]|uniref:Uncharacterized protein C9orf50 homolog n=1 Tax=Hipposideros armiger TaxID=186990 RepID=A0A8B7RAM4_HIPAR|nr:PREDICTED: uncharacterized protein C9orf50 homolog [Hipposideros armiger]
MRRVTPPPRAQQVEPKGFPSKGDSGVTGPLLPRLPPRELGPAPGAKRWGDSRASGGGAEWWQASSGESSSAEAGTGVWSSLQRLPTLRIVQQRAAPNRTGQRSLLPPPLILDGMPWTRASLRPGSGECEDSWRGSAREAQDSLGAHLGEFLPSRFQKFLYQLGAECVQQPPPQISRGVSEHCQHPQCPNCSFLPDLRSQTSYFQNSLKERLLHQIPTLGPLRSDHTPSTTIKKANNRAHGIQAPKLKAVLTHSSSGEDSRHCRRYCPFRVRFADETLRDIALRYWERSCALQQGSENGPATQSAASERVFDSVGQWLESLPKTPYPRAEEEAVASSLFSWDCLGLPTPALQGHLPEDTFMNTSLPFIPSATPPRQQTDLKTFLGTHSTLEQVYKPPCSCNQKLESFLPHLLLHKVLKRGRPKGYQPLLPSVTRHQAQP